MRYHELTAIVLLMLVILIAQPVSAAEIAVPYPEVKAGHGYLGAELVLYGGDYEYASLYKGELGILGRFALTGEFSPVNYNYYSVGIRYQVSDNVSLAGRLERLSHSAVETYVASVLGGTNVTPHVYAYTLVEGYYIRGYTDWPPIFWEIGGRYQLGERAGVFGRVSQAWVPGDLIYAPTKTFGAEYEFFSGLWGAAAWSGDRTYLSLKRPF